VLSLLLSCLCHWGIPELGSQASLAAHRGAEWENSPAATNPSADLLQAGKTLYDAGRYAEAVNTLQQALQGYRSQGDKLRQAVVLSNLSLTYQQLGQWAEANPAIGESVQMLRELSPVPTAVLAQSFEIQGRLQLAMGQAEAALATWQAAETAYRQVGDTLGEVRSQINQAQALQATGFYRRALDELTAATTTLQPQPDSLIKTVGLRSLGDAFQLVGNLEQAQQTLQQSLVLAQRLASPMDIAATYFSLGNVARAQQQTDAALEFYQQAIARSPTPLLQVQAHLNRLSLLAGKQQTAQVTAQLPQIQSQLETLPASRATVYARINLAQTLITLQPERFSKLAAQNLAIAIQQARSLGDHRAEAYALGSLGGLYERTQQWSTAQALTEQALLLAQSLNAPDISYRWQWQLGRLLKQQNQTPRAIVAYEAAVESLKALRSDLVSVNRDIQFNFRDSVEPVYRETVELLLRSQPAQPDESTLDKARRLIESLQLAELDNFFREACLNAQSVLLDQVVDRDNPTAAILYPIILDNQLDVILKVPNQPLKYHSIRQSRREVERVLTQLRETIEEPDTIQETRALANQVYTWLIQPIATTLRQSQVNTLVFVLDGQLRNIPMASLYDGQQYLIEQYAIALSPSLQLFAPQPIAQSKLNALTAGLTDPPPGFGQFAPLPEVKSELNLIQSAGVETTQLINETFTSQALEQEINAAPYQVVHLATHGQFSSEAKNTFILAADGPINVSQLDSLLRKRGQSQAEAVELLVLSACQTASGDNRATLGLAGVAIRAGARSTLASLWYIDDRSTALFIGEFYRQLATATVTKAEALRRAQVALLNDPNYNRPGYWAPYVLVGNWL
jgi:CHAT domain-containing protein